MNKQFYRLRKDALRAAEIFANQNYGYVKSNGIESDESLRDAERFGFSPDFSFSGEVAAFHVISSKTYDIIGIFAFWEE